MPRPRGDARTGIILEGGAVGIGDLFGGIVTQESTYEWGFSVRFDRDARVKVRSLTFARDAFLSDAYLETVGLAGKHYVAAGTYFVVDHKLTVPVRQQRDRVTGPRSAADAIGSRASGRHGNPSLMKRW